MRFLPIVSLTVLSLVLGQGVHAQTLSLLGQFSPGQGGLVGLGFDQSSDSVWIHGGSNADVRGYSRTGTYQSAVPRPGESTNDADVSFAPVALTLGSTLIPAGSLLFVNGESGAADIYAVDKTTGSVLASLTTGFGVNHVVGMSYHAARNSFFLVADELDSNTPNRIAEISPTTGSVLNSFGTGSADFTVSYGDVEVVPATGSLMLVSSDENRMRELSPTGTVVQDWLLPSGVSSISGIGVDGLRGEAFLSGTGGTVWRVGGLAAVPAPSSLMMGFVGAVPGVCFWLRRKRRETKNPKI